MITASPVNYEFGPFRLDATRRVLLREAEVVPLPPKAYEMLCALVRNSGQMIERTDLIRMIWGDQIVEEANLSVYASLIRKALGENAGENKYLITLPKRGYLFAAQVRKVAASSDSLTAKNRAPSHILKSDNEERDSAIPIAVLPFRWLSRATSDKYLSIGLADALITRLSNARRLLVRPTGAIVRQRTDQHDPVAIGNQLQVKFVLEGSIRKSSERIRITVQLVSVGDGAILWAEKFDEEIKDILALEDSIVEKTTQVLLSRLDIGERVLRTRPYTQNTSAYRIYLNGCHHWTARKPDSARKAIECFEQALELDPGFALAYARLSHSYLTIAVQESLLGGFPPEEAFERAKESALKALAIDDTMVEAHATLAGVLDREWDWDAAEKQYLRAIELNPNYLAAHLFYSMHLAGAGRIEEAMAEVELARQIDPLSTIVKVYAGSILYRSRQYDEAIRQLRKVLEEKPDFVSAIWFLGIAYKQTGMYAEAISEFQKAIRLTNGNPLSIAMLACALAAGNRREARKLLKRLQEISDYQYVPPYYLAVVCTAINEKDQAFNYLEKAYRERSFTLGLLNVDPEFDLLREDSRFAELSRRIGRTSIQ